MKIAIIGAGIAGLTSAWYLRKDHDIQVYEANPYVGGHTATVDVSVASGDYAIDTGFIVFNDRTYPRFEALLAELGIEGQPTQMSFSVHDEHSGLEYNGHTLATLFAQKRNLLRPSFYRFIGEILRFNKLAKLAHETGDTEGQSLGQFLARHGFSDPFCRHYILPMGAAIWSSTLTDMRAFPLGFFLRFFLNHGLLDVTHRPQWSVIPGGSREYVKAMLAQLGDRVLSNAPVKQVERQRDHVVVHGPRGPETYDQVIFACHSDQALRLLADPSEQEQQVLGAIHYQDNEVILHTDTRLLPKRRAAWAAWNYRLRDEPEALAQGRAACLTYDMNILQGLDAPETFCVSLNQGDVIHEEHILRRFTYAHPVFNTESLRAQGRRWQINGRRHTWFCGAYWYNGFHEDGVRSALDVVEGIGQLHRGGQGVDPARDGVAS